MSGFGKTKKKKTRKAAAPQRKSTLQDQMNQQHWSNGRQMMLLWDLEKGKKDDIYKYYHDMVPKDVIGIAHYNRGILGAATDLIDKIPHEMVDAWKSVMRNHQPDNLVPGEVKRVGGMDVSSPPRSDSESDASNPEKLGNIDSDVEDPEEKAINDAERLGEQHARAYVAARQTNSAERPEQYFNPPSDRLLRSHYRAGFGSYVSLRFPDLSDSVERMLDIDRARSKRGGARYWKTGRKRARSADSKATTVAEGRKRARSSDSKATTVVEERPTETTAVYEGSQGSRAESHYSDPPTRAIGKGRAGITRSSLKTAAGLKAFAKSTSQRSSFWNPSNLRANTAAQKQMARVRAAVALAPRTGTMSDPVRNFSVVSLVV
jgi:hypothetical protein